MQKSIMFDPYSSTSDSLDLVNAIVVDNTGIEINPENITFIGADNQASFYDGSIAELGIGSGILLTSGDGNPNTTNTSDSFSVEQNGITEDSQLQAVADSAFEESGEVQDINSLEFSFTVTDPNVESVSFNLVFGSEEFPEFSDSAFVDVGAVFVNGQNVGLFNNDPNQPLSIISENLNLGNFQDNAGGSIPIEYDGVSSVLSIVAPVEQGENTIRFAIADTGDSIYDSGLFISNFATSGANTGDDGSGVLINASGTEEADEIVGDDTDQFIEGLGGNDTINPGGGNDIIDAGAGDDLIVGGVGSSNSIDGGEGNDTVAYSGNQNELTTQTDGNAITVSGNNNSEEFTDTLTNIETIQYGDGSISTDTLQPTPPETDSDGIIQGQNLVVTNAGIVGSIDLATGEITESFDADIPWTDIDVDPDGNVYAISFTQLYAIDLEAQSATLIGNHGVNGLNALEIGADGTFYATSSSNGDIFTLDPTTGEATSIGTLPQGVQSAGDLQFINDTLYLSERSELVALDVEGNALNNASIVGTFDIASESIFGITIDEDGDPVGFTDGGDIVSIDLATGLATPINPVENNTVITGAAALSDDFFDNNDNEDITGVPVYRFFRTDTQTQFYTTTELERDVVLDTLPQYELEGVSFVGAPNVDPLTGTSPVYRFFNTSTGVHLYTADENERASVEENLDNYVAEGTPYYGYDTQVEGTVPLYRFYNSELDAHFYTPSAEERDLFIESPDYVPEGGGDGIAFYVEPVSEL